MNVDEYMSNLHDFGITVVQRLKTFQLTFVK